MVLRSPRGIRTALPHLAAAATFLIAAVALTWPMAAHFTTRLGGDAGDPFQTLWSWRWMRDALASWQSPFFTDRVFYPHGSTLVFETFDLPTAILAVPLWSFLPPFGVYNAGVLFAFWLTAWGMYRLVDELTGDRLVAACAGVLFTAAPYHLAHVQGHQHLVSMGWLPLYFASLHRILAGQARRRDAVLGGVFLAVASLASWYHLLYAMVGSAVLFADAVGRRRSALFTRALAARASVLAVTYLAIAGPLLAAILVAKAREPIYGAHDAVRFSGDLQAFFVPNLAQRWSELGGNLAARWTGNAAENGLYAGYSLLGTALLAAMFAGAAARAWVGVALTGAILALGPKLHIGGQVWDVTLPYAWLERLLPQIEFMGVPVRLGYLMYLGLIVSAALGIAKLRSRWLAGFPRAAFALIPAALTLVEYAPRPFIETEAPVPRPMLAWAKDPARFAVLDISDDYRMMWHATLHRKPMIGGNLTRIPDRLEKWYWDLPIVQALRRPGAFRVEPIFERADGPIDFVWRSSPDPRLRPDSYRVEWTGTLDIPREGEWTFFLTSDDGARLELDGTPVVDNGGVHPMIERQGARRLAAGSHAVRLGFEQVGGDAGVKLEWAGPAQARQIVPATAMRTVDGVAGLRGVYSQGSRECAIGRDEGRAALRALGARYVVTGYAGNDCLSRNLALRETYRGEGVRIWEIPSD